VEVCVWNAISVAAELPLCRGVAALCLGAAEKGARGRSSLVCGWNIGELLRTL